MLKFNIGTNLRNCLFVVILLIGTFCSKVPKEETENALSESHKFDTLIVDKPQTVYKSPSVELEGSSFKLFIDGIRYGSVSFTGLDITRAPSLHFQDTTCYICCSASCCYMFECRWVGNKIELLKNYSRDCIYPNNTLDAHVDEYPKSDEAWGEFLIHSDSILIFKGYEPKRLKRFNALVNAGGLCDTVLRSVWYLTDD